MNKDASSTTTELLNRSAPDVTFVKVGPVVPEILIPFPIAPLKSKRRFVESEVAPRRIVLSGRFIEELNK